MFPVPIVIDVPNFKARYDAEFRALCTLVDDMPQIMSYYFLVNNPDGTPLIMDHTTSPYKYLTIETIREEIKQSQRSN